MSLAAFPWGTIFFALFMRSNSAAASLLTAVPPRPTAAPVPLFLLRSELKKFANTPSLAAPPAPAFPPSTCRRKPLSVAFHPFFFLTLGRESPESQFARMHSRFNRTVTELCGRWISEWEINMFCVILFHNNTVQGSKLATANPQNASYFDNLQARKNIMN